MAGRVAAAPSRGSDPSYASGVTGRRSPVPVRVVQWGVLGLVALALLAAPGCLPLPDIRPPTAPLAAPYRVDPATVPASWRWVAGFDEPATPDRFDRQGTLRWALDEPAETIVVALPGLFGGAAQVGPLARRLVATVPGLQVWAVDRRANQLEDHGAAIVALGAHRPCAGGRRHVLAAAVALDNNGVELSPEYMHQALRSLAGIDMNPGVSAFPFAEQVLPIFV